MPFPVLKKNAFSVLLVACTIFPFTLQSNQLTAAKITLPKSRVYLIKTVTLASDIPGIIKAVNAKEGDEVEANLNIVQLNDDSAKARLKIAEEKAKNDIDIKYSEIAAEVAENEYKIALQVNEKFKKYVDSKTDISPPLEMKRLKLSSDKSYFQIDKSKAEHVIAGLTRDEAVVELKKFRILTPFKGVVTEILKHPGEAVRQGEAILEMVNTDVVKVEGEFPYAYINKIRVGQKVIVRNLTARLSKGTSTIKYYNTDLKSSSHEIKNKIFNGKITFIDVKVNPGRGSVIIRAEVENQDNLLRDGLLADIIINLD
jgi:multidrug efflux pump subunit AcrA (membrane-fusion protein)